LHALFHNTAVVAALRAGEASGAPPGQAEALFHVRYLAGATREEILAHLRRGLAGLAAQPELSIEGEVAPRSSPPDSPLATAIREVMGRLDPGVEILPAPMPASTDLRELEAVAYGFTPMRRTPAQEVSRLAHGRNERLAVEDIALGIEATVEIARRLGELAS
ncbi:MAG: M20/M25/M40 family metallo-hydrolase, partial [Chloroflexi bacterium]|nr:M20/M25/M40 family metallo-hydrolase [Chloroflexota bacterium]